MGYAEASIARLSNERHDKYQQYIAEVYFDRWQTNSTLSFTVSIREIANKSCLYISNRRNFQNLQNDLMNLKAELNGTFLEI